MKLLTIFSTLFFSLLLGGCSTPRVILQNSAFGTFEPNAGTVFVEVLPEELSQSIEARTYVAKINTYLRQTGYTLARNIEEADRTLFFSYEISGGNTSTYSVPVMVRTNPGAIGQTPIYTTQQQVGSVTSFTRVITLLGFDNETQENIYQYQATSTGSCRIIAEVMDEILEGIFRAFPASSGRETVTSETNC